MNATMKAILILAALLLSPLCAAEVELGTGLTRFGSAPNGTWYQEEFDHKLQLDSPSLSVGVRYKLADNLVVIDRINLRAGYEYLGRVKSSALATASDEDYATCRYDTSTCWPLSHWYGVGDVQGLYVTLQPEIDIGGGYALFAEAGVSLYRSAWQVDIPDWRPTREGPEQSITAVHKTRWERTSVVGVGVRHGAWSLAYTQRNARATGDEFPAAYEGTAHNVSLRYAF